MGNNTILHYLLKVMFGYNFADKIFKVTFSADQEKNR